MSHSAVIYKEKMYIFGGKSVNPNSLSTFLNDFWSYDVINKKWEQISCRGEIPDPIKGKRKKKRIFKIKKKKKKIFLWDCQN